MVIRQKDNAMKQEGGQIAKWREKQRNRDRQRDEQMSSEHQGVNKPELHSAVTCGDPVTM